jgi:hypothetical protein
MSDFDFRATKLVREDFPESMPREVVDRILEAQAKRNHRSWVTILAYLIVGAAPVGTMIMGYNLGWPYWTPGAAMIGMGLMTVVVNRVVARDLHRALVEQGFTCDKCRSPLGTDTWSVKRQQIERDSFLSGRCPTCHHPLEQARLTRG